jgi:hypothetical protein
LIVPIPLPRIPAHLPLAAAIVLKPQPLNFGLELLLVQLTAQQLLVQMLVGIFQFANRLGLWLLSSNAILQTKIESGPRPDYTTATVFVQLWN